MTPPISSARTRLWSVRAMRPSRTSQPISAAGPQTASAVSRSQPPTNTASRESSRRSPSAEEVVAPGDRPAQRLLPLGQVAGAGREDAELVLETLEDRLGLEQLDPRRGELDRQRHAVQPGADPGDGRSVLVRHREVRPNGDGAGDEQPDRLVLRDLGRGEVALRLRQVELLQLRQGEEVARNRQARNRVLLLAGDAERRTARHDDREPIARRSRSAIDRRPVDDLLEVVEDEQDAGAGRATRRGGRARIGRPTRRVRATLAMREATRLGSRTGSSGTNQTPSANSCRDVSRELERQPGLARAAGPGQRQQAGRREEDRRLAQLRFSADEARQLGGQIVRAGGRASGSAESRPGGRRSRAGRSAPAGGP